MSLTKLGYILVALITSWMLSTVSELNSAELISVGLFVYFLLDFLYSVGRTYNILDIPILLAIFQCLLMPAVVYHYFNNDYIVIALRYDMGVPADTYYTFMLPAVIAMIIGFKFPLQLRQTAEQQYKLGIHRIKEYLKGRGNLGILLIVIGVVTGFLQIFIPGELRYVAYLFNKLLFVGILYTFFSDAKNRKWFLIGGIVVVLAQSLAQGMFGELVYISALTFMLILLGQKLSSWVKTVATVGGFVVIFLIQSVKGDYRDVAWFGKGDQGNTEAFFSLILERITNPSQFFDIYNLFPTVNRFNQGMIVGKVMVHVPANAPFAEGETIFTTLAASFVPRLLWPDKPMSGGQWNMERFTGFVIEGYSMNVSPLGEAYGNFGVQGGIFFMILYGLFFNVAILVILRMAKKYPTLLLWFPVLFLNSVQIETDILMCVNSLIKNSLFIAFCYWAADRFLRLKL